MVHRVIPGTDWFSRLSPIYYYNLSKPLITSYGTSAGGMLAMLAMAMVLTGAALWLLVRRDVGDAVKVPWLHRTAHPAPPTRPLQVNRWSADEDEGRLEIVLSTPQSRAAVLLGRFAALATATVIVGVVTLATAAVAAAIGGVALDGGNLAAATLGMIPLGLLIAAIGYLAAGWLRTAADTGLLSFLLAAWFFISFIGPDLKWPDATLRLSPFS